MTEDKYFTYAEVEAAICIFEEALHAAADGDRSLLDWLALGEGAVQARSSAIDMARSVELDWNAAIHAGYDDSFDWEFVPRWLALVREHYPAAPPTESLSRLRLGHRIAREYADSLK